MNERKFSKKAVLYDKYRPRYSKKFIDYLYDKGLSKESVVADIGAGTGVLTEALVEKGTKTIVVEPNIHMLRQARAKLKQYKNVEFLKSSAEDTKIQDESVDFITVGQAFHWFDKDKFKKESKRIIKPNGKVVLAYNMSDSKSELNHKVSELNKAICKRYRGYSKRDEEDDIEYEKFYEPFSFDKEIFENDLSLSRDAFIGRCLSRSYAPSSGDPEYETYVDGLNRIFDEFQIKGKVLVKNKTKSYIGRVK